MGKRVSQKDIAKEAGVARSTVSMAFSNHASIASTTKERILAIAKRMGYAPDPMLSALSIYRASRRPAAFHGTLAWLHNSSGSFEWRQSTHYSDYFKGAAEQARRHGYQLDIFDANETVQPTKRLMSIFAARNIRGILLCPQPAPHMRMELAWENYSLVTFGYSLVSPRLHMTAAAHYLAAQELYHRLRGLGYERIGLAMARVSIERSNGNYLAGYLVNRPLAPSSDYIPPFLDYSAEILEEPATLERFSAWLEDNRLDAIMVEDVRTLKVLAAMGKRVPEDIAVASPCLPAPDARMSGIVEDSVRIGAVAMDFVVAAMHRGERGVPDSPQRIHVEGKWNPGSTI